MSKVKKVRQIVKENWKEITVIACGAVVGIGGVVLLKKSWNEMMEQHEAITKALETVSSVPNYVKLAIPDNVSDTIVEVLKWNDGSIHILADNTTVAGLSSVGEKISGIPDLNTSKVYQTLLIMEEINN